MNQFVVQIFQSVFLACGSNIALLIPVPFDAPVDACNQDIASNIEFPLVVEKRIFHILLDDEGAIIVAFLTYQRTYLSQRTHHLNAMTSVGVLSWFANPDIASFISFVFI